MDVISLGFPCGAEAQPAVNIPTDESGGGLLFINAIGDCEKFITAVDSLGWGDVEAGVRAEGAVKKSSMEYKEPKGRVRVVTAINDCGDFDTIQFAPGLLCRKLE